ncbi:MAG: APC family permease [Blastocatellia bacterium]
MKAEQMAGKSDVAEDATIRPTLIRAIGRWGLTAVVINSVIGSGIFGMPSAVAGLVGARSPLAILCAGGCIFIVVLCFAEVGSRFQDAGGPYLYVRETFGAAVGFQIGWLQIWTRVLSCAATLNVLIAYLAPLVPAVRAPAGRALAMTGGMVLVTAVNVIGVRQASWAVNGFTVAKLAPLLLVALLGGIHFRPEVLATQTVSAPNWTEAILLLVFAYGGFESAVVAASETRNPKRDTAFALIVAMSAVTAIYCLVQLAVMGVLPNAARSSAPVAAALGEMLGPVGLTIGSLAVVISIYGWLTGFALMTPRILFSMAERRELPSVLARVHPRFRTPHAAIAVNSAVALGLGLYSSFTQAAALAAISRLGVYGLTCAALIILRKHPDKPAGFHLPGGRIIAVLGIAFSCWLISTRSLTQAWLLALIPGVGALLWVHSRRRRTAPF